MFCKSCGKELDAGIKFCKNCGAKVENNGNAEAQQTGSVQGNTDTYSQPIPNQPFNFAQTEKKKSKAPIVIAVIAVVVVIAIVIAIIVAICKSIFGNSISVEDVKEGYLPSFSKTKTVGSAFDNYSYFEDISWEEFDGETDDGEDVSVVEFNATIMMDNYDSYDDWDAASYVYETLTVQFYTDDDMDSDEFGIYGIWFSNADVDGTDINLDDYDFEDILDCIYNDEMFLLIPSDYGLYYYD